MSSSPPSPSPFLNRFWPILVLVLAAFGVPAAATTVFSRFIAEHSLLALSMGVLYEVVVFILSFVGKVWQRLESRLVDRSTEWLDHWIQRILSRYQKRYYQYLRYQHQDFDMKGLSIQGTYTLELDQVFVELRIDPTTPHQATVNPIQVPQSLLEGNYKIWDYLASIPLRNQHFVIIGPPGSGKATLLKHITLTLVSHRKLRNQPSHARIPHKLPILLYLRDHLTALKEQSKFSLVDALYDHLKKWEQSTPPQGWVEQQLKKGRCIVMLDGLDEVADPEARQSVVIWVERQMKAYPLNRFIITSRPFGYLGNPLSGVAVLEVRPFTIQQVELFIHKWYLANEIMSKRRDDLGVRMRARAEANGLLQQLRSTPALFDLTGNPLLLTMIATIHLYGGELSGNRVALYSEICEVFLGKRQKVRGQELELTPAQMQLVLEPLAYHLMVNGTSDIALDEVRTVLKKPLTRVSPQMTPETFLQLVENVSGLLLERENGVYSFAHLTFQEYLAAKYIREKQIGHTLVAQLGVPWWQETIRLYCMMADATPIIAACLAVDHPSTASIELAIDCDKEAHEVQPEVRTKLAMLLKQGVEDPDNERQHVIAGAVLSRRLRRLVHLKDAIYVDTSLITCAEYQIFLDEQRARGLYLQPDHWTSYRFPPGHGNDPVLGVRPSDATAFCTWLTERDASPWLYRLPEVGELEKEGDKSIFSRLPANTGYWLKDGKGFAWTRETLMLPGNVVQETRDHLFPRDLTLARDLSRSLARDLTLARDLANGPNLSLARDLIRDLTNDLTRNNTIPHNLSLDLARARDLVLVLDRACKYTSALNTVGANDYTGALASANASALTYDLVRDLNLAHDLASALARIYTLNHALARARDLTLNRDRDLVRTLNLTLNRDLARTLNLEHDRDFVRDLIYHQEDQFSQREKGQVFRFIRIRRIEEDETQPLIESLLDIYLDLVILGKRIREELPACEGILIVRESK